uniref:SFRICE_028016 n=1 Tax=Spodoptera frugiperda TaxID=7108 RepID=A0A2H1WGC3_SPOFR
MASFEDLAFDWASLCQDCPECWTESGERCGYPVCFTLEPPEPTLGYVHLFGVSWILIIPISWTLTYLLSLICNLKGKLLNGVSVIGEGLFIMSSVRRRGDVAPPTPLIYIKSLNLSRMVTLTSVNLSDNSHKTATAVDELIEGYTTLIAGDHFTFHSHLEASRRHICDFTGVITREQKHVTKTKSTSIVSLANLIKITPAVLEFMKNIYTAYKHIV